jgi:hypothetical protein
MTVDWLEPNRNTRIRKRPITGAGKFEELSDVKGVVTWVSVIEYRRFDLNDFVVSLLITMS